MAGSDSLQMCCFKITFENSYSRIVEIENELHK